MATFVVMSHWTEQGIRNVKDTIARVKAIGQAGQASGVRITSFYWTLGPYDTVAVVEAPDDETVTRFALGIGMQGNARTTTMRAFGEAEMTRILQGLP